MKRFISLLMAFCLCSTAIFADVDDDYDDGNDYDDGYIYEQNGAGDKFLKIDLLGNFPLNFGKQLYPGAGAAVGYYSFISSNIAVGGEVDITYNLSLGLKPLIIVPITFGAIYQPYVGKFEFPLMAEIGVATLNSQNLNYFPAFTAKLGAGAYYRFIEGWSAGLNTNFYWIPQWCKDSKNNDNGLFATAAIGVRYHF